MCSCDDLSGAPLSGLDVTQTVLQSVEFGHSDGWTFSRSQRIDVRANAPMGLSPTNPRTIQLFSYRP